MTETILFLIGALVSLTLSAIVLNYLDRPLTEVLEATCDRGTSADFWRRYSQVMLMLAPVTLLLAFTPSDLGQLDPLGQLRWLGGLALAGQLAGLAIVGRTVLKAVRDLVGRTAPQQEIPR